MVTTIFFTYTFVLQLNKMLQELCQTIWVEQVNLMLVNRDLWIQLFLELKRNHMENTNMFVQNSICDRKSMSIFNTFKTFKSAPLLLTVKREVINHNSHGNSYLYYKVVKGYKNYTF